MYDKTGKICQHFKKRNTIYGRLTFNNKAQLKLWYMANVDLIRQQQPGGATIKHDVSLTSMTMIDPAMGWF